MKKTYLLIAIILLIGSFCLIKQNKSLNKTNARTVYNTECREFYYLEGDIIGYFRDVVKNESYYITFTSGIDANDNIYHDWCVVKAVLWWGGVFEHYSFSAKDLQNNLENIFPEYQVYYGLIPYAFIGTDTPQKGYFATEGMTTPKKYGYFTNDNPFKNIFGNSYPQPPQFIKSNNFQIINPPSSMAAGIIMKRMKDIHANIFVPYISKGACNLISLYPNLQNACQYFERRTMPFVPSGYNAFLKLPEYQLHSQ
ncbi:MAG TPA: hypothetical protein PK119_00295 [Candidatus Paceibacterota bacterium]|nr:hypothetical protein [Candidatus Paceibacterota bacterium]